MLPRCRALIPDRIKAHGLTDDPMMSLDAMAREAGPILRGTLPQHPWSPEGKHHGLVGRAVGPVGPGLCRACS
jgi:hypothetical protein